MKDLYEFWSEDQVLFYTCCSLFFLLGIVVGLALPV